MAVSNNFKAYQKQFHEDTGLTVNKDTMSLYIQYYLARTTDADQQALYEILQIMKNSPALVKN